MAVVTSNDNVIHVQAWPHGSFTRMEKDAQVIDLTSYRVRQIMRSIEREYLALCDPYYF